MTSYQPGATLAKTSNSIMTGRGFSNLPMRHMYAEMNDVVKININMTQEQREILSELVQRAKLALKPRIKGAKKE